jgi:hypothetical protein
VFNVRYGWCFLYVDDEDNNDGGMDYILLIEREMCPWAISINVLVIRCPTHIVLVDMC